MLTISKIHGRQIFDSRGMPTVEVDVHLSDGSFGRASVPSGASTGSHEALELRDGGAAFAGKGVLQAVGHVNKEIFNLLHGKPANAQAEVDAAMRSLDGTNDFSNLGANATLGVSLAVAKAVATSRQLPLYAYINNLVKELGGVAKIALPRPMFNILNGGAHTNWQTTDMQEFMVVPLNVGKFSSYMQMGVEIYQHLKKILRDSGYSVGVGDEGGFAPKVSSDEQAIELILQAIETAGYQPGVDVGLAFDAASSEWYKNENYQLPLANKNYTSTQLIDRYANLLAKYPIMSLEDGLAENDWQNWTDLTKMLGKVMSVGDDLLVTNTKRIQQAIAGKSCNALLAKVNQIGTLTDALTAISTAQQAGWQVILSHRSGETEDNYIADIAVGVGAQFIKSGATARSERLAKYNQLLRIAEELA